MASIAQEQNNPFVWNLHNELEIDGETGSEIFNIFDRLDTHLEQVKQFEGTFTPYDFWSVIDIRIRLPKNKYKNAIDKATTGAGNAVNGKISGGNGWGVTEQKLSPLLYELVNANPNIMDWRATEAIFNHFLKYTMQWRPAPSQMKNPDYLFDKYTKSHNLLVEKYRELLEKVFKKDKTPRDEFMKFLESSDVELANIESKNPETGEKVIVRNVVRSFPNYWHDSNQQPTPTYLYHYKKMNFLLKTIADCNYLAFDILLDILDVKRKKHKDLLVGSITLYSNADNGKSNIRSRFPDFKFESNDLTKPYMIDTYSRYGDGKEERPAPIPREAFTDENSPFNINNIDLYANKEIGYELRSQLKYSKIIEDARRLFIDVAERSGIRLRHSNEYGYPTLKPENRHLILDKNYWEKDKKGQPYKWKYDWLFQHSYAGEGYEKRPHTVGDIQPGLNKKYILTFILQHAYETNDRRLFENYRRFKHIYGNVPSFERSPNTFATDKPYYETREEKIKDLKINTFEFVDEFVLGIDLPNSASERWLTEYNKKLIEVGHKFLDKLKLPENYLAETYWFKEGNVGKEISSATKFFLASVDKQTLGIGSGGYVSTGLSNTTSSFMVENQDRITLGKRAWLWWLRNDLTLKDRPKDKEQAKLMKVSKEYIEANLIGTEGFSGFFGVVNLFGSPYNLNECYNYYQQDQEAIISILTFKQTFNKVFEKEYKKQGKVQDLLILDEAISKGMNLKEEEGTNLKEQDLAKKQQIDETEEQKEKKDKKRRTLSTLKKVVDDKNIVGKISTFGGKRRKKTKSKYNKRMSKRTRRKRGGTNITQPDQLIKNTEYSITRGDTQEIHKYIGKVVSQHMNLTMFKFEPSLPLPIHFGELGDDDDGWVFPDERNQEKQIKTGFFVMLKGKRNEVIISAIAGGRRRRRKRRTKRKKKSSRRKKYKKKKSKKKRRRRRR